MYNDIIIDNFTDPTHIGEIESPDYEFELGNPVCGDRIRIHLMCTEDKVDQALFRAWGCATSVATANIYCESILNTSLQDIEARSESDIEAMLGELEPSQAHCIEILKELHRTTIEELSKELC